jgi:hypothetical protein
MVADGMRKPPQLNRRYLEAKGNRRQLAKNRQAKIKSHPAAG